MKEPPPPIEEESFVFVDIIAHPSRQICHSDDALSDMEAVGQCLQMMFLYLIISTFSPLAVLVR